MFSRTNAALGAIVLALFGAGLAMIPDHPVGRLFSLPVLVVSGLPYWFQPEFQTAGFGTSGKPLEDFYPSRKN